MARRRLHRHHISARLSMYLDDGGHTAAILSNYDGVASLVADKASELIVQGRCERPPTSTIYQRLVAGGKSKMVAVVASMRKFLIIL